MRRPQSSRRILAACWVICLLVPIVTAEERGGPEIDPGQIIQIAVEKIEQHHFSHPKMDVERSTAWFDSLLLQFDPQRMYFLRNDFDELRTYADKLVGNARRKDFSSIRLISQQFQKRVREATQVGLLILSREPDFSTNERFPLEYLVFADDMEDRADRWRRRITAELLTEKLHGRSVKETQNSLLARCRRVDTQAQTMTDEKLCQIALNSLLQTIDASSAYFGPTSISSFNTSFVKRFALGLELKCLHGEIVISKVTPERQRRIAPDELIGWALIGFTTPDDDVIDLTERYYEDVAQIIWSSSGPLKTETEIVLELRNPATWERKSISWGRMALN